jgi:hypothetical protein
MYDFAKWRIGAKTPASKRMAIRTDVEPPDQHPATNNPERQCNDRHCGGEEDEQYPGYHDISEPLPLPQLWRLHEPESAL